MKECPKCGHIDEPYWRATYNRKMGEDYTHIDNFRFMFGEVITGRLQANKNLKIGCYFYRLTKHNNVIRRWAKWENTSVDYEKHMAHINNPEQSTLKV